MTCAGAGAPIRWEGGVGLPCLSTPFLLSCQKKRCRAAKEKRFEASTSPWWAHPPLPFGRKPQRDELVRQVGLCPVGKLAGQSQLDAVGCDVGASSPWERRAGPNSPRGGTQKRVSLGLHPVSLRKSKEMGWNRQYRPQTTSQEIGAHVPALLPKVGRGTSRPPTCSAHANGGATGVKKALFFGGSTPFLWASTKEMGSKGRTGQRPPPSVSAHTYQAQE